MSNKINTDAVRAARDVLSQLNPEELEYMLYDVRADHQYAVHTGSEDEPEKRAILELFEIRAQEMGINVTA